MPLLKPVPILLLLAGAACRSGPPPDTGRVEAFVRAVAQGVTSRGPAAWADYFDERPSFFMAAEGALQFDGGAAARAAIPNLVQAIKGIRLEFGNPLRIDVLTADLASVGAPWHEIAVLADGKRVEESGYFTAIAENREGRWRFRNAHWSTKPAAPLK